MPMRPESSGSTADAMRLIWRHAAASALASEATTASARRATRAGRSRTSSRQDEAKVGMRAPGQSARAGRRCYRRTVAWQRTAGAPLVDRGREPGPHSGVTGAVLGSSPARSSPTRKDCTSRGQPQSDDPFPPRSPRRRVAASVEPQGKRTGGPPRSSPPFRRVANYLALAARPESGESQRVTVRLSGEPATRPTSLEDRAGSPPLLSAQRRRWLPQAPLASALVKNCTPPLPVFLATSA
jgi:hypothetical protein